VSWQLVSSCTHCDTRKLMIMAAMPGLGLSACHPDTLGSHTCLRAHRCFCSLSSGTRDRHGLRQSALSCSNQRQGAATSASHGDRCSSAVLHSCNCETSMVFVNYDVMFDMCASTGMAAPVSQTNGQLGCPGAPAVQRWWPLQHCLRVLHPRHKPLQTQTPSHRHQRWTQQ
jgi:hypothetical protein